MKCPDWTQCVRRWAEKTRLRRRVLLCVIVPLGFLFTLVEFTVIGCWAAWKDWAQNWYWLWKDVKAAWKE